MAVVTEPRAIPAKLTRRTALELLAIARQAERSIDALLAAPAQWADLRAYYAAGRIVRLAVFAETCDRPPGDGRELARVRWRDVVPVWLVPRSLRPAERAFVTQLFGFWLDRLAANTAPHRAELIALRIQFVIGQVVVGRILCRADRAVADRVEQFNPPFAASLLSVGDVINRAG